MEGNINEDYLKKYNINRLIGKGSFGKVYGTKIRKQLKYLI